ncbi:hypothetical protein QTP70_016734, partial [Hemibagrus guttatus]
MSRRHPKQMPEPPQLPPFDVEEQRLYSELLPGDRAPYPISKGAPCHPTEEAHFGRLYPGSYPFGHDPELMTIGVPCLQSYSEPTEGRVYRMYHGTSAQAAEQIMRTGFKQSAGGMLGRGVYLSRDLNKASRYPLGLPEWQRVVIR